MYRFATTRSTTTSGRHGHRCAQGFCTVCGSTWPCWGARIEDGKVAALRSGAPLGVLR